jgi:putative ABC transport system substrate-binding protein
LAEVEIWYVHWPGNSWDDRMQRRRFIGLVAGAAAWPFAARAQQRRLPIIGYLNSESLETYTEYFNAFHKGLNETGYVEGRNVGVEYRWADGQNDRLPALAADLVRREVTVIVTNNTPSTLAAKSATESIPTVFLVGSDPVLIGLVASLNRPGGQLTGVSILNTEIIAKRLEILHELVPAVTSIAFLMNPTNPVFAEAELRGIQAGARALGLRLLVVRASSAGEIDTAFGMLLEQQCGALLVSGDTYFIAHRDRLLALCVRHRLPAIYVYREMSAIGGLVSYGPSLPDGYRQTGVYVGRILKGEKPFDLPVQQVTKIELVINFETAKALGITVPLTLYARADEIIE